MSSACTSTEKIAGIVDRITFHNPATGFCVLRLQQARRSECVTVVGSLLSIHVGESIEATGQWVQDRVHGLQFKASHIQMMAPTTVMGIEKYLGSGLIKGIGPHFAKQLVAAFGERTFEVIEQTPERLTQLMGIGDKRKQQILSSWNEQRSIRALMVFLQQYHLSGARAVRIYKRYGEEAIAKIQENPYRLARDVYGIGFKTADLLAMQMNIAEDSPIRAIAGLQYVMQRLGQEGHCAVSIDKLKAETQTLLTISESIIVAAITVAIREQHLILSEVEGQSFVALANLYQAEASVALHLTRLFSSKRPWSFKEDQDRMPEIENAMGNRLSFSQQHALQAALKNKVLILTGGPGVGKTMIIKSLLHCLKKENTLSIQLCAPTGRAAKRLSESTGWSAKTIHRLLEFDPKQFGFKHHQQNPLTVDWLIVDEISMLDIVLMNQLLSAVPDHAAVLLIGDQDQLPSVGPGRVLADLIESERLPVAKLTEIFRQAGNSKIIVNAHRINQGQLPIMKSDSVELSDFYFIPVEDPEEIVAKVLYVVSNRIPKRFHLDPMQEIQVLAPMNKGRVGVYALNSVLQAQLNGHSTPKVSYFGTSFAPGDKIMQCINNYDKEVFNGDIGYVRNIDLDLGCLWIEFEGRSVEYQLNELDEISLAYAMSIHKSQGSEYSAVVIPMCSAHYPMLARNLLYTGVTRGKRLVILIGQKKAIAMAVHARHQAQRLTQLQLRLKEKLRLPEA